VLTTDDRDIIIFDLPEISLRWTPRVQVSLFQSGSGGGGGGGGGEKAGLALLYELIIFTPLLALRGRAADGKLGLVFLLFHCHHPRRFKGTFVSLLHSCSLFLSSVFLTLFRRKHLYLSPQHAHASPQETIDTINQLVRDCRHGEKGAHAVAHSFGCVVIQWLIRLNPGVDPLVSSLVMVDPVCFLLFSPSIAGNFCYRFPKTFLDLLVSYFVAREIGVNNALHRHFQWRNNNMDPELLPAGKSAVILSELDAFVPSEHVERLLKVERPDVNVAMLKSHFHSQFQVMPGSFKLVANMSREVDK